MGPGVFKNARPPPVLPEQLFFCQKPNNKYPLMFYINPKEIHVHQSTQDPCQMRLTREVVYLLKHCNQCRLSDGTFQNMMFIRLNQDKICNGSIVISICTSPNYANDAKTFMTDMATVTLLRNAHYFYVKIICISKITCIT